MVPNSALFKKWQSQIWNWHHFFCSEITFYRLKWTVSLRPIQRQYLYFLNRCWSWWKYQYKNFPGVRRKFPGNENWEYLGDSPIFQKLGNSPANRWNPFPGNMQRSLYPCRGSVGAWWAPTHAFTACSRCEPLGPVETHNYSIATGYYLFMYVFNWFII